MINFPLYLRAHWIDISQQQSDIVESIEGMNIIHQGSFLDDYTPHVLVSDGYTNESCAIYEKIAKDKDVRKIAIWIHSNIILPILKDERITTEIKIRIASSMLRTTLNDDNLYRYTADALVANIKQLQDAILDVQLPF